MDNYNNNQGYNNQGYNNQGYNNQGYNNQGYDNQGYVDNQTPSYEAQPYTPETEKEKNDPKAIASLICGIASIVCCCSGIIGIGAGVAAIITGILSRKNKPENNTMATVGLILGIAGAVLSVAAIILALISMFAGGASGRSSSSFYNPYSYYFNY